MPPKLSEEYVREVVESFGCKLIGGYKDAGTKIVLMDAKGHVFKVLFHLFIKDGHSHCCQKCGWDKIGMKLKNDPAKLLEETSKYGFYFDISSYKTARQKMNFIDSDGYKYFISYLRLYANMQNNNYPQKFSIKNPFLNENINNWMKINNKNYQLLKCFINNNNRISVLLKCNICNETWDTALTNFFIYGNCPICTNRRAGIHDNLFVLYPYLMTEWDYEYNKIDPLNLRPKSNKKASWICSFCGHKWIAGIAGRTEGNGCPACKMSGGAKKIYFWLQKNNYNFEIEYKFDDLLSDYGVPLRYDFYVFNNYIQNVLIEFDGGQHENFIPIFHKNQDGFEKGKRYDSLKDEYAKNKGINLIRISYRDFNSIEDILVKNL